MTPDAPLPGLATDAPLAAGRRVIRCGICGRPLESREARLRGLGDGCRHKVHGDPIVRRPARFDVEQDGLFGEREGHGTGRSQVIDTPIPTGNEIVTE
jgi:hypothetical protein